MHQHNSDPDEDHPSGEQYFAPQPQADSAPREVIWRLPGGPVRLWTDHGMFAPGRVDRGTDLLARTMDLPPEGEILDLGAGYGPLALAAALRWPAARLTLVEINQRAAALAERNLQLHGVENAEVLVGDAHEVLGERRFDAVICNPPLRSGKVAVLRLLTAAAARLRPGGALWLVVRTAQGAKTLARDLGPHFSAVETVEIRGGYRVFRATVDRDRSPGGEEQ